MLREIAEDLLKLEPALRREGDTVGTADAIATFGGSIRSAWRRNVHLRGEVPLPLPRHQGIHPKQARLQSATMSFSFLAPAIAGQPVETLRAEIQVCIKGTLELPEGEVSLEDHWRMDTHAFDDEEAEGRKPPREAHPLFHFQRGGHAQDTFTATPGFVPSVDLPAPNANRWCGLMQHPGPRVAVMPMCPTTAMDYVISQHNGLLWRKLRNIPEYGGTVERCHDRMWKLYADGLADPIRRKGLLGHF